MFLGYRARNETMKDGIVSRPSSGFWILLVLSVLMAGALSLLAGPMDHPPEWVIMRLRLPRLILALLTGSALSISGCVLQSLLRNDLATPYTLGISAGAGLVAGSVIVSIPSDTTPNARKKVEMAHMIQPVMADSRNANAVAAATTPTDAVPCDHNRMPQPTTPTTRKPFCWCATLWTWRYPSSSSGSTVCGLKKR